MHLKPNPFHVLRLPTDASKAEIVQRGQELGDLAPDGEQRALFGWALEQLIVNPALRLRHELFEVPGAQYEDAEWERFQRAHLKPPPPPESAPLEVSDFDLLALFDLLLDGLLDVPPQDITPALRYAPFAPNDAWTLELKDVIFG